MDMLAASWRDIVMLVAALVGVYLVLMVMRLFRVGSGPVVAPVTAERMAPSLSGAPEFSESAGAQEPMEPIAPSVSMESAAQRLSALMRREPPPEVATPDAPPTRADFAAELARSSLEVEVQQLRRESAVLRQQLAGIQNELAQLKAMRNVSPLYSEAVSLAQRGMDADGIASQCGISLGEAELVAALARADTENIASEEDGHGGHPGPGRRTGTHG